MKLIPFALIFASAIFCSTIRNKIDPTPTPLPTLGATPTSSGNTASSPSLESNSASNSESEVVFGGSVSGGMLNDKAKSLPQPVYPAAAKAVRASGNVLVNIQLDIDGKVQSATAVSGHPLLRKAAEDAARKAIFEPTLLSGKPVRVTGTLTYHFNP